MKKIVIVCVLVGMLLNVGCTFKPNPLILESIVAVQRKSYIERYSELAKENSELILKGLIVLGFSRGEVKISWGVPDEIHTNIAFDDSDELWMYKALSDRGYRPYHWLYFKEGILVNTYNEREIR